MIIIKIYPGSLKTRENYDVVGDQIKVLHRRHVYSHIHA